MNIEDMLAGKTTARSWTDLPFEMLALIVVRLALIDLLSFRGTCRYWRASSSTATAENESYPKHKPWLLLYGQGNTNKQSKLCNPIDSKKYNIDIPELKGAHCIASLKGWLLLHCDNGTLFFFSPFSRAKIELPSFPNLENTDHMAAISAPPSSEKCVICIINRHDELKMDLHVLHRGNENWMKIECTQHMLDMVTGAIYDNGTFYFLDDKKKALLYSVGSKEWKSYRIVESKEKNVACLPFFCRTRYFKESDIGNLAELEDDLSISTCGTVVSNGRPMIIQNETIVNGETEKSGRVKGIWIEPLFCQIRSDQKWSL